MYKTEKENKKVSIYAKGDYIVAPWQREKGIV